ncbi:hypothetical protein TNCV_3685061 [Trichonephila clavipes]|uniref:Uncharacterized protein n=1 Tax=Trichonephila clavipes TaxID=2585209 RepID=A0A8X6RMW0_TRICX|nr:hypothetical protein TNCV_3685061 [Trichonephila clavipes]
MQQTALQSCYFTATPNDCGLIESALDRNERAVAVDWTHRSEELPPQSRAWNEKDEGKDSGRFTERTSNRNGI